jgi:hypothetical protein
MGGAPLLAGVKQIVERQRGKINGDAKVPP